MSQSLTITLPLPDTSVLSHPKGHWRGKTSLVKQMRERAYIETMAQDRDDDEWPKATMSYAFYFPDDRRRDLANYIHGCKPYVDGILDACIFADDCWQCLSIGRVTGQIDRAEPRVEITVEATCTT